MAAPLLYSHTRDLESPKFILTFAAGLNENQTPDVNEASEGYNFELGARQTKFIPRTPYDLEGTVPNGSKVTSIMQLIKRAGTKTTLVGAGTSIYSWTGANNFTLQGSVLADALLRDTYWSLGDFLVITDVNKNNVVKKWDGTTFSNLTTGLANPFYAKYAIVHLNRVWYFNITCGTDTPHMILASTFENPEALNLTNRGGPTDVGGGTFSTGLEPFFLLSPDLKPINGVAVFQRDLVISTVEGRLFKLTGTDSKTFQFIEFYVGSAAIGNESIANIGNDVIYMRKGGNITLLTSTQNYGDVKSNEVSRWIPDTVMDLPGAIIIYDQSHQKVFFFIANKVLVLFKDILFGGQTDSAVNAGLSPWSVYTTLNPNNFNTSAAKYMQHPDVAADYAVYWGDANGNIYDMHGVGLNGDGGLYPVDCKRKSRIIDVSVINPFPWSETLLYGKVQFRRKAADSQLSISFDWSDEFNKSTSTVTLKGPASGTAITAWNRASYWGGGGYWNQGNQLANVISHQTFSPTGRGAGFYLTLQNQSSSQFQVDHVELY